MKKCGKRHQDMDQPEDHELEERSVSIYQLDGVGDHIEVVVKGQRDGA